MPGRRFGRAPKFHATPVFVDERGTVYTRADLEAACLQHGIPVMVEARHRLGAPTLRRLTLRELAAALVLSGQPFASKAEARRFLTLRQWQREGRIRDLRCQVPYDLHAPGGDKVGRYVADFVYQTSGGECVEDVKGVRTRQFVRSAKHMLAEYGVEIAEVRRGRP
jgi:hypothetical protein